MRGVDGGFLTELLGPITAAMVPGARLDTLVPRAENDVIDFSGGALIEEVMGAAAATASVK